VVGVVCAPFYSYYFWAFNLLSEDRAHVGAPRKNVQCERTELPVPMAVRPLRLSPLARIIHVVFGFATCCLFAAFQSAGLGFNFSQAFQCLVGAASHS
jgi:hypothetical protein